VSRYSYKLILLQCRFIPHVSSESIIITPYVIMSMIILMVPFFFSDRDMQHRYNKSCTAMCLINIVRHVHIYIYTMCTMVPTKSIIVAPYMPTVRRLVVWVHCKLTIPLDINVRYLDILLLFTFSDFPPVTRMNINIIHTHEHYFF
jgi:hypothetical protein